MSFPSHSYGCAIQGLFGFQGTLCTDTVELGALSLLHAEPTIAVWSLKTIQGNNRQGALLFKAHR